MSKFDDAYLDLCEKILKEGKLHHNRTGDDTLRILGHTFEFDLGDEFPILTTKQVGIKGPVIELLWIYQARSNDVSWLRERGVTIWDEWEIDSDGVYRQDGSNRVFGKDRKVFLPIKILCPIVFSLKKFKSFGRCHIRSPFFPSSKFFPIAAIIVNI